MPSVKFVVSANQSKKAKPGKLKTVGVAGIVGSSAITKTAAKDQSQGKIVNLNARPDRIDLRDRVYQPKLTNLPPVWPEPKMISSLISDYKELILDQGTEGACTGFGLAAVINFLIFRESVLSEDRYQFKKVSPSMLYRLARIYDEWPGDDYEGSSCRGAMKGWHKYGVCSEKTWPYDGKLNQGPKNQNWEEEATAIPLGAYYRIDKTLINDMQSAVHEVGAIYVSAEVHDGWQLGRANSGGKIPIIEFNDHTQSNGGHAFAIVGYTADGFIVQNSWGKNWGNNGFAVLNYADWLKFGTDAWVAVMGVPRTINAKVKTSANKESGGAKKLHTFASLRRNQIENPPAEKQHPGLWAENDVIRHSIIIGSNGLAERRSPAHADGKEAVDDVAKKQVIEWSKSRAKNKKAVKVVLFAHGGLNSENASTNRISVLGPWFEANDIFPIFFSWKTGFKETIESMFNKGIGFGDSNVISTGLADEFKKLADKLKNAAAEAKDRLIESLCSELLVRALWTEMKENAEDASREKGAFSLTVHSLNEAREQLKKDKCDLEIHLIGHSAGAILLGHAISKIDQLKSLHLYAPACTVEFANEKYLPAIADSRIKAEDFYVHNLDHATERLDSVGPYGKSLVFLIHRALERLHKTPILGMEAVWNGEHDAEDLFNSITIPLIQTWRKESTGIQTKIYSKDDSVDDGSGKLTTPVHGSFDNDINVINFTIEKILGEKPAQPVTWLVGY